MGVPKWDPDVKGRARSRLALRPNGAAVQFDQFMGQGEADAAALERAALRPRDPVEPLEEPRQFRLGVCRGRYR